MRFLIKMLLFGGLFATLAATLTMMSIIWSSDEDDKSEKKEAIDTEVSG